jgi:hypothetical protein
MNGLAEGEVDAPPLGPNGMRSLLVAGATRRERIMRDDPAPAIRFGDQAPKHTPKIKCIK